MKIWSFIKWQYLQFEFWQKTYLLACMLFGLGIGLGSESKVGSVLFVSGIVIILFWCVKWFVIDSIKNQYYKFKSEQQNLLEIIKNSDRK